MLDFCVFGAGRIGKVHAPNIARHPKARLRYIVDPDLDAGRALAEPLGAEAVATGEAALADDSIGLSRFREKYAPLMSESADRLAFDIASKPAAASSAEFAEIAKLAASVDTLDGFLREMKQRFPDATARAPGASQAKDDGEHTGSLPTIPVVRQIKMTR